MKIAWAILFLLSSIPHLAVGNEEKKEEKKIVILKVRYTPVEGTDVEYGQGAIERNELEHSVISASAWLIRVPAPGDPVSWQGRLNASVDPAVGSFVVKHPTADELRRVDSGELKFQK